MQPQKIENSAIKSFIETDEASQIAEKLMRTSRAWRKIEQWIDVCHDVGGAYRRNVCDSLLEGSRAMCDAQHACIKALIVNVLIEAGYAIEDIAKESVGGKEKKRK